MDLIVDQKTEGVPRLRAEARTDPDIISGEGLRQAARASALLFRQAEAFGVVGDQVEADQRNRLARRRNRGEVVDARLDLDRVRKRGQRRNDVVGNTADGRDFQIRAAR